MISDSANHLADIPPILPTHIEQTVNAIARLNAAHERRATPLQVVVDRLTAFVARPIFIGMIVVAVVIWIGANLLLNHFAGWSPDRPAFPWLQGAGELAALCITTLVLMSQRRKDELSELREQLTLELVILIEQKDAKLIALLEEMRRDSPLLVNRVDAEADAMSTPADPEAVMVAFHDAHEASHAAAEAGDEGET